MSSTYSGNPAASARDEVRFLLQDTAGPEWLFSDAEVDYAVTRYGPLYGASAEMIAAHLCDALVASYAGEIQSVSADGVSTGLGDVGARYAELAARLRESYSRQAASGMAPFVGGVSPAPPSPKMFHLEDGQNPRAGGRDTVLWPTRCGDAPVDC